MDEALFVDARRDRPRGHRRRTSGGGTGETLCTPSLDLGILAGVTRATLMELAPGARIRRRGGLVSRSSELLAAEEAFTSSSVREVMPLVEIDGHALGRGPAADGCRRRSASSQLRSERWRAIRPARRHGAAERRPRARPDRLGMRGARRGRSSAREVRAQAELRAHGPAAAAGAAGTARPRRSLRAPADGATRAAAGALPVRATQRPRRDPRHGRRGARPPTLAALSGNARARRGRRRVPAGRACPARSRPRRVPRGRAHRDRHLRERRRRRRPRSTLGAARS